MNSFRAMGIWIVGVVAMGSSVEAAEKKLWHGPPSIAVTITKDVTLEGVLNFLADNTAAKLEMDERTMKVAKAYRFPPHLIGAKVKAERVGAILGWVFGSGWEGSLVPVEQREVAGDRWRLVRAPMSTTLDSVVGPLQLWACNNVGFDWRWDKPVGGPPGGIITVKLRTRPDGDLIQREPILLDEELLDEYALDHLRDLMQRKTRIYVNFDPEDHRYMEYALIAEDSKLESRITPMTVRHMREEFGDLVDEPHTLGDWLSMIATGLNRYCQPRGCLWKWSMTRERGRIQPIYTIRCYAHPGQSSAVDE